MDVVTVPIASKIKLQLSRRATYYKQKEGCSTSRIILISLVHRRGLNECIHSVSLRVWNWGVDYAHCWTPHIAALAQQALKAPLTCTLALFPAPFSISTSAVCGAAV